MAKLKTKYLGLEINSPVIVGSSSHTATLSKIKQSEDYGAGAVILKSLFEEQINYLIASSTSTVAYPEADDYMAFYLRSNTVDEYLELIRKAKESINIPVIASINCISAGSWIDFARRIEEAGADALEVNMFFLPLQSNITSDKIENTYLILAGKLKEKIKIPLSIKLGFRFTNVLNLLDELYKRRVEGVVMFNRFFEPDIDTEKMTIVPAEIFSEKNEMRYVLRWIAMASAQKFNIDISASTGVYSGTDAVKYILAGASSVQVCSALYKKGLQHIGEINRGIIEWMERKGFESPADFRGKLNYSSVDNPVFYERTQFMKHFSSYD